MSLLQAIIMGFIQGITEFLPVSSSGHLALFKNLFSINLETGLLFDVMLHFGTLVAIFIAYWTDIKELIIEGVGILLGYFKNIIIFISNISSKRKRRYISVINTPYRRFVMMIIISTIPTAIMGVLFSSAIEKSGEILLIPGIFLILTSILLIIADNISTGSKTAETASYKNSLIIGIAQGFATMPGLSRSGTTITACLLNGFNKEFAVKYSFIMSIPAVLGAALLEVKDIELEALSSDIVNYIVGTVVAAVVGYISIKLMLGIVKGKKFKYFAYYCAVVGVIAVAGYFILL